MRSRCFKYPSPPSLSKRSESATRVNFLSRVASNLENGRNDKKMEDGQDHGQIIEDLGAGFIASSLLFVGVSTFAADGEIKSDLKDMRQDNREIRGDRRELHGDFKELKGDRKELRGASRAARATQRSRRIEKRSAAVEKRSKAIGAHSEGITANAVATDASCDAISTTRKQSIRLYFSAFMAANS
jgi:hypothetical protein